MQIMTFWNMWRFQDLLSLPENDINVLNEKLSSPISLSGSIICMESLPHCKTTNSNACIFASLSCFHPFPTNFCNAQISTTWKHESTDQKALDYWYSLKCISSLFYGTGYNDSGHSPSSLTRSSYFMLMFAVSPFRPKAIPQDPAGKSIHFVPNQFSVHYRTSSIDMIGFTAEMHPPNGIAC